MTRQAGPIVINDYFGPRPGQRLGSRADGITYALLPGEALWIIEEEPVTDPKAEPGEPDSEDTGDVVAT